MNTNINTQTFIVTRDGELDTGYYNKLNRQARVSALKGSTVALLIAIAAKLVYVLLFAITVLSDAADGKHEGRDNLRQIWAS